jgi:regulator of vacuolar morphogenesis
MEVTIPSTSISDDATFTVYHVHVRVGEKSTVLQKRYSDFASLKSELESMYSATLPYKFPRKRFLKNTVKDHIFAEERRSELEDFLRSIAEDEADIKWKKSLPFKEFLNLPPGIFSSVSNNSKEKFNDAWLLTSNNNEPITDLQSWLNTARDTKKKLHSARSSLYKAPSETRKELVLSRVKFESLRKGLDAVKDQEIIGDGEFKRRSELLKSLQREHHDIEQLLSNVSQFPEGSTPEGPLAQSARSNLFKGRVIGQPQETQRTRGLDDQQLLQLQKNDFQEQDQELDLLSKAIERQKQLGTAINEELALQNEILDELDTEVDRASSKLHYAQKRVGNFT